jgi:hypothetical protein
MWIAVVSFTPCRLKSGRPAAGLSRAPYPAALGVDTSQLIYVEHGPVSR